MSIDWDLSERQFHLHNGAISLVLRLFEDGTLGQLHLGAALPPGRSYRHLGPDPFPGFSNLVGSPVQLACPTSGTGDFRIPTLVVAAADGATSLSLHYRDHRISAGKPALDGLPSTYVEDPSEAETLEITLVDEPAGLEVDLRFTIFDARPVIARSAVIRNAGSAPIDLRCAMSLSLDLPDADWQMVGLSGSWARERHVTDRALMPGRQSVSSIRGASGHEHNPFLALRRVTTDEAHGETYGFSLVYSGNFLAEVEVEPYGTARVRLGIEPSTFGWRLEPGATFTVPEAITAYSEHGTGGLSDAFHALYRDRLARGHWRDRPRPVLINNWEATYFGFDADRLVEIATTARDLGVELFVLDDGWFGARDDDTTSLGDWFVDRHKLPDGLDGIARRINELGIGFGLWIEPEMISRRSRLFEAHPDWAIGIPGRPRTESRQQLVLDMARPEVVDHLTAVLTDVLASAPIAYVKWDMNRNITEPYSPSLPPDRQGEFFHRYILGTYELYRRLTERFPEILFESCAGGGGRFDPGLLAFAPQAWTSDDTDAIERLSIQWGTSLAYPLSSMAAHVAAVPNHQVGRITPLSTRAAVAFFGVFGYELDPTVLDDEERAEIADQIAFYTAHRDLFQRGRFVRLLSPFEGDGNRVAWMSVAGDRRRAVVGAYQTLSRADPGPARLRLRGLDPDAVYRVTTWPGYDDTLARVNTGERSGAELMAAGLILDAERWENAVRGDFWGRLFVLDAI
ncbi:MAG: alpha-galactosidase [Candidatus Limnocylindrales bacterium]